MSFKQINDVEVRPVPLPKTDKKEILGSELFDELYSNIYLCAKKKSGKTSTIYNIIKRCCDKRTAVFVFCSTYGKDQNWRAIKDYLDRKSIENEFYSSIKGDDGKENHLKNLVERLKTETSESEESEPEEEEEKILLFSDEEIKVTIRKRKPKKTSQRYLFIFDDISTELKDPNISHLLKTNRHYKSKVIISSQWLNDLLPMARRQIDVYMIFSGINNEKLEELFKNADLNIEFPQFVSLYREATNQKYSFFYVDASNCKYRKNFNMEVKIFSS